KMGYDPGTPFFQMAQEINGNTNIKYADLYGTNTTIGKRIVLFAGSYNSCYSAGISNLALDRSASYSDINVGSRLLKTAL
ncbi:MAG: hypothetical protein RSB77_02870, partial [Bacilli bacterium]